MFNRCVQEEATQTGQDVRVLNYAPGPLDTLMQTQIREVHSALARFRLMVGAGDA